MSSAMSQRMVWVDLEASQKAKTGYKLYSFLDDMVGVAFALATSTQSEVKLANVSR